MNNSLSPRQFITVLNDDPTEGVIMLRVDGAYLYDFGNIMAGLSQMEDKNGTRLDFYFPLNFAHDALKKMVFGSVFQDGWRVVYTSANDLLSEIAKHLVDFSDSGSFKLPVSEWDVKSIKNRFATFESIMKAELQNLDLYYVSPKGGFDNRELIQDGLKLFPGSIKTKSPEAIADVQKGARCMAFELWTAMGFHFHRANEAVLRRYYASVIGDKTRPKILTMGTMLSSMEQHSVGDVNIKAALKNITVFHRNPIAHPDHHIESGDDALSLYASIRAAMGYMLDKLPVVEMASGLGQSEVLAIPATPATIIGA